MQIPFLQTSLPDLNLLQTKWRSILNAFIGNPSLNSVILENISIGSGSNSINHTLGRKLLGWRVIRINGVANIYDTQSTNSMTDLTLNLVSSAAVLISLEVF